MWRTLQYAAPKAKGHSHVRIPGCLYATSTSSNSGGRKTMVTLVTITSLGAGAVIAYGKYDPKFRKIVEENVPYSNVIFKSLPDWSDSKEKPSKTTVATEQKAKEAPIETSLLKKKQERQKKEDVMKPVESKPQDPAVLKESKIPGPAIELSEAVIDEKVAKPSISEMLKPNVDDSIVIENLVKDLIQESEKRTREATSAQNTAVEAIKNHTSKLYEALDKSVDEESTSTWKQVDAASTREESALHTSREKMSSAQISISKLRSEIQKYHSEGKVSANSVLFSAEETADRLERSLKEAAAKVAAAQVQVQTAADYRDLVNKAREQFKNELQIVLPKYVTKGKDQQMTESEQNLLIAHAHRRIEHLQKEIARLQVTEKQRIDEAKKMQKSEDEKTLELRIISEVARHEKVMEAEFEKQLEVIQDDFEMDLRHQLRRQAAAHADHLQEALQVQREENERKFIIELESQILQQKGVFISEISGSMSKLQTIEGYLQARARLNEAARKTQALWLACQAMKNSIKSGFSESPKPLGKELAIVKSASDESPFVTTVLSGIPLQAVERGIYTDEYLKQRFTHVKRVCRRVAIINDENRSLYRYILSYFQSMLIIDRTAIPTAERDNKVAVDPSEWDTFDILNRISFCLQRNDMEQALRYANQLQGEPLNVAKDWISELQLLLETSQAVDCLIAYATAVGVQAYH